MKSTTKKHLLPGFGLTMGVTVSLLSLFILIPLASVLVYSLRLSFADFIELMSGRVVRSAFMTSIGCALIAAAANCVIGVLLAWVLTRYDFPGRKLIDGMIELPFALPTAVAGITLTKLYSNKGLFGMILGKLGIEVSYTKLGIIVALIFVGIPFIVRSLQPVLEKMPKSLVEAGTMLGASKFCVFRRVILPELMPALLAGFGLALARGIGEYGSVIYISGNSAKKGTQVVSYIIMQKLNSGSADYESAAAIALVLLIISFALMLAMNLLQLLAARRTRGDK